MKDKRPWKPRDDVAQHISLKDGRESNGQACCQADQDAHPGAQRPDGWWLPSDPAQGTDKTRDGTQYSSAKRERHKRNHCSPGIPARGKNQQAYQTRTSGGQGRGSRSSTDRQQQILNEPQHILTKC